MTMSNSKSSLSSSDESDENDERVHNIESLNVEPEDQQEEPQRNNEHILLTSRKAKKHVTIQVDSALSDTNILEAENALERLGNDFQNGFEEIKNALKKLKAEKQSFEVHIRSLEDALKNSAKDKENCANIIQQQEIQINALKAELEAWEKKTIKLQGENITLQSDHEDHMNSIADQHRKKLVARRTLRKWKEKIQPKDISKSQIYKIMEENEKLKKELIIYQKSTKEAFLRSASVLNTEALSLFQNTTSRLVNLPFRDDLSSGFVNTDNDSTGSSESSLNLSSERKFSNGKENKRKLHSVTENLKHSFRRERFLKKSDKALSDIERRTNLGRPEKSHSDNEIQNKSRHYARVADFAPDSLRRETREIMKQLESAKNPYTRFASEKTMSPSSTACHSKNHVHICHCTPLPGRTGSCPYCYPNQNINFRDFTKPSRPQPKKNVNIGQEKESFSRKCVTGERGRVIYKPSGSTVVIEKHVP
ncbi:UNVERIFIED_CONTAM: hypothetical protein RMT77_004651 [Armadillidium vulgare]